MVVELNLELLKAAVWVIDLGPEGGAAGGKLIAPWRINCATRVKKKSGKTRLFFQDFPRALATCTCTAGTTSAANSSIWRRRSSAGQ